MTKFFLEIFIPASMASYVAIRLTRYWYLKVFPKGIKDYKEIKKVSRKYGADLKGGKP